MRYFILLLFAALSSTNILANQKLISYGTTWKYLDNGSNQGTAWRGISFNDTAWKTGSSQFGYGENDESTVLSYGADANNRYVTTYFRKKIVITNPNQFTDFSLNLLRDDGVVIYVNNVEVYRSNMGSGAVTYTTLASLALDDGSITQSGTIPSSAFINGTNIIAVELHQSSVSSSDLTFDMELIANQANSTNLTRGPYLQKGSPTSVTVRWRTDANSDTKVKFGTNPAMLTDSAYNGTATIDHIITLYNLSPNTNYYYSIGTSTYVLQGNAENYFKTPPLEGTKQAITVWATGDCGTGYILQQNVRDAYRNYMNGKSPDVWALLGDNAYDFGTDTEYQNKFFNIYGDNFLKNTLLYPTPGNHDYANNPLRQDDHDVPYYNIFSLPYSGEAGGLPSATPYYYSYNYGNVHFVSLDSYGEETGNLRVFDTLSPQVNWLKNDLAQNTQDWTILYWHHPPYTKGSHDSDTESELVNMRNKLLPILERYKVDLILCGHSHAYERSYLLKNHYGLENTFTAATHAISSSSGKYDGSANSCPYIKNPANNFNGTVYVVAGSAGKLSGTTTGYPHNAMYYSDITHSGSLALEIYKNRLDAKFIASDGNIYDNFTIMKGVNLTRSKTIQYGSPVSLSASWQGNYNWSNNLGTTQTVNFTPLGSRIYTVTDDRGCITDRFNVKVLDSRFFRNVYPNPSSDELQIEIDSKEEETVPVLIYDINGRLMWEDKIFIAKGISNIPLNVDFLPVGRYFIHLGNNSDGTIVKEWIKID